jgi:hypothetical protein
MSAPERATDDPARRSVCEPGDWGREADEMFAKNAAEVVLWASGNEWISCSASALKDLAEWQ